MADTDATLDELRVEVVALQNAVQALDRARARRDAAIVAAVQAGVSQRAAAGEAGLSHTAVQKIIAHATPWADAPHGAETAHGPGEL